MEQVPCGDMELVLSVLEDRLRTLTPDVVREGERITMFGLGPSPRALNPHDRTVIDVRASNGSTTIDADVSFQASSFLADMRQDTIVLGKLERVFEEMKAELEFKVRRMQSKTVSLPVRVETPVAEMAAAGSDWHSDAERNGSEIHGRADALSVADPEAAGTDDAVIEETPAAEIHEVPETAATTLTEPAVSELVVEEPSVAESMPLESEVPAAAAIVEPVIEEAPAAEIHEVTETAASPPDAEQTISEPVVEALSVRESLLSESEVPALASVVEPVIEEAPAAETHEMPGTAAANVEPTPKIQEPVMEEPTPAKSMFLEMPPIKVVKTHPLGEAKSRKPPIEIRAFDKFIATAEEEPKRTGRVRLVATVATLTIVAIAGARYFAGRQGGALPEEQPEAVSASTATASLPVVAKPVAAMAAPSVAPAPPAPKRDPTANEDPAEIVKQWETALRTRDAGAQAAFYDDPVDRYFLGHDVKKDSILADKQAAIEKRKDGWTIKMERVQVQRKGDDIANVNLVKHYMVQQDGRTQSEWFVPSRLQLKRADGRWHIVSERDLGWASSLEDLDG